MFSLSLDIVFVCLFGFCFWLRGWLQCLPQLNLQYTIFGCLNKVNL